MKKKINRKAKDTTESWLGVIAKIGDMSRRDRANRISTWAKEAGPPHAEIMLGDDPDYMERIGFWQVPGGVIRIRASKRGEFDPAERTDITDDEVKAIAEASLHIAGQEVSNLAEAEVVGSGGRATVRMKIHRLSSGILQCRIPGSGCWQNVDPADEGMFINPDDTGRKVLKMKR